MRVMDDFGFPDNKLPPETGRVRILLSHMPLLTRTRIRTKQVSVHLVHYYTVKRMKEKVPYFAGHKILQIHTSQD